jgi:hypothetical protein
MLRAALMLSQKLERMLPFHVLASNNVTALVGFVKLVKEFSRGGLEISGFASSSDHTVLQMIPNFATAVLQNFLSTFHHSGVRIFLWPISIDFQSDSVEEEK